MATLTELFTNIANAIRSKKGTTEPINAQNFASEIESIEVGSGGEVYLPLSFDIISTGVTITEEETVTLTVNDTLPQLYKCTMSVNIETGEATYSEIIEANEIPTTAWLVGRRTNFFATSLSYEVTTIDMENFIVTKYFFKLKDIPFEEVTNGEMNRDYKCDYFTFTLSVAPSSEDVEGKIGINGYRTYTGNHPNDIGVYDCYSVTNITTTQDFIVKLSYSGLGSGTGIIIK